MSKAPIAPAKMQRITAEISAIDKRFAKVISESPLCTIGNSLSPESNFQSLVSSVISQQLAVKAAETIHGRLNQLAKGQITPVRIAKLSDAALREIGVSGAKAKTIQGLAQASLTGSVPIENLHELSDEEVFTGLTSLWGIGPWTVDMFMMFQLHRLDIWPTGDLGVRRGWESIHKLTDQIEPKALDAKGEKFRPYRSVVAWYCWRHLDNKKQENLKQAKQK
jgi:DNA-3-methyladenine glycosylase II